MPATSGRRGAGDAAVAVLAPQALEDCPAHRLGAFGAQRQHQLLVGIDQRAERARDRLAVGRRHQGGTVERGRILGA